LHCRDRIRRNWLLRRPLEAQRALYGSAANRWTDGSLSDSQGKAHTLVALTGKVLGLQKAMQMEMEAREMNVNELKRSQTEMQEKVGMENNPYRRMRGCCGMYACPRRS
jgi:hypothetical protein